MSGKADKKLRQQYRRDLAPKFHDFSLQIDKLIRPRPKFFPKRLWFWLQGKFVNFPEGHEYWQDQMKKLQGYLPDYWPEAQTEPVENE